MHHSVRTSGALKALAPDLADDIAAHFPFPHHPFFELAPARMHLLGMLITGSDRLAIDFDRLRSLKWQEAGTLIADPCPTGLERILSSMPLPVWSFEDYRKLWSVMTCQKAMTVMRHAREVTPALVAVLYELPPILRTAKVCRHVRQPIEASVLARMCDTTDKAALLLVSITASGSRNDFYETVLKVVRKSDVFPAPPVIDHPDVRPILDLDDLRRTALAFQNCMRVYADQIAVGSLAFYVVEGEERAVVSVKPLVGGRVVIDEMKGVGNTRLSDAAERRIRSIFQKHGMVKGADERRRELMELCLSSLTTASMKAEDEIYSACWAFLHDYDETASPDLCWKNGSSGSS
jgi:hypothetical protein